jgi:TonB family protein
MSNGDARLADLNLQEARRAYELAYALQPDDATVIARLDSVNQLLTEVQNREQQYAYYRGQGDALFARGNYDEAMESYQSALTLQPNDTYVTERIQLLNDSIETEADAANAESRATTEQYTFHRAHGDSLFELGQFEAADASYRTALTYQPDDAYLSQRLTLIADSLAAFQNTIRLTDAEGIYLVTDTDPVLLDEREVYSQIRYPSQARSNNITGRVTLRMIVHESGTVSDVEIVSEPGYGTGEEAVRVIQQARFQPARYRDRPVPAWHTFSVAFVLN